MSVRQEGMGSFIELSLLWSESMPFPAWLLSPLCSITMPWLPYTTLSGMGPIKVVRLIVPSSLPTHISSVCTYCNGKASNLQEPPLVSMGESGFWSEDTKKRKPSSFDAEISLVINKNVLLYEYPSIEPSIRAHSSFSPKLLWAPFVVWLTIKLWVHYEDHGLRLCLSTGLGGVLRSP